LKKTYLTEILIEKIIMVFEFKKDAKTIMAFHDKLRNIGVKVGTFYTAEEYKGPPKNVKYQLCLKESIFSKKVLMLGENEENLRSMLSSLDLFYPCEDWKLIIRQKTSLVRTGCYTIIERMKFTGTKYVEKEIKKIIKEFGGNKNDIDFILNSYEEKMFAFSPSTDSRMAEGYAKIIQTAADIPIIPEEWISFLKYMKKGYEYAAEQGDESAKRLAGARDRALKLEKKKLKQKDTEEDIELKYINKYEELLGKDYIEQLLKEYHVEQNLIFDPLFAQFNDKDRAFFYSIIDNSKKLEPKQKIEAILALLSMFMGSLPNEAFMAHLEKIYPPKFIETFKETMNELNA
jgi:hypothetical protein